MRKAVGLGLVLFREFVQRLFDHIMMLSRNIDSIGLTSHFGPSFFPGGSAGRTAARDAAVAGGVEDQGADAVDGEGIGLVSHQDALLLGGKVQAPPGYADHVVFLYPHLCETCGTKICIEVCSGEAISPGADDVPLFDREKCVHSGACVWNCTQALPDDPERTNIEFRAGPGGLHSVEN